MMQFEHIFQPTSCRLKLPNSDGGWDFGLNHTTVVARDCCAKTQQNRVFCSTNSFLKKRNRAVLFCELLTTTRSRSLEHHLEDALITRLRQLLAEDSSLGLSGGSRFDLFVDFEGPSDLDLKSQTFFRDHMGFPSFFFLEADFCF